MKRSGLEPGLLQVFRLYIVVSAIGLPFFLRLAGSYFGISVAWERYLFLILPVPLFMILYTHLPWFEQRLGRAFLPVGLVLFSMQAVTEKTLTLHWLISPPMRELTTLLLMVRLWLVFQFVLLFAGWQYTLFWVTVGGVALCLLDSALSFPLIDRQGAFYPLFVVISGIRLLGVTGFSWGVVLLMQRQRQQRAALAKANRKLAQRAATVEQLAVSQERNHLARELHDTLAHSLSAVTVQLEAADALWEVDDDAAHKMLDQALQTTRSGLTEARRALAALRASPLEDLGLALAVRNLAESVAARANLSLDLDVHNHLDSLPPDIEQCVYRVAQEALTNVARHAAATALLVALARQDGALQLRVSDDGCGFDASAIDNTHFGLQGLRERAEMMGALLVVESEQQKGTTVTLSIETD